MFVFLCFVAILKFFAQKKSEGKELESEFTGAKMTEELKANDELKQEIEKWQKEHNEVRTGREMVCGRIVLV